MVKRCTVCAHPSRPDIDRALLDEVPYRRLAAEHGLSPSALSRHTKHLRRRLALESRREDLAQQAAFQDKLQLLETRLERLYHAAQNSQSLHIALGCIQESVRLLSLQQKMRHSLGDLS